MQNEIIKLKGHFVICGIGRMGIAIAEHFAARGTPFVVIDDNEDLLENTCRDRGWYGHQRRAHAEEARRSLDIHWLLEGSSRC